MVQGATLENDFMQDIFESGTPQKASGTKEYSGWRLDFTPDSPTVVRARLRRGRGKNRNNVKDDSGTVIVRNYVPLGRIEDVEGNPKLNQWHARCAEYRRKSGYLGSGERVRGDSGTTENGVARDEKDSGTPADIQRLEEWHALRGGDVRYTQ